jgi:hypothetical protein
MLSLPDINNEIRWLMVEEFEGFEADITSPFRNRLFVVEVMARYLAMLSTPLAAFWGVRISRRPLRAGHAS